MILEALFAVGGLVVVTIAYLWGRSNGHHDGYFKGLAERPASAKIEERNTARTIRIAKAAYARGYRKALEDKNESSTD